MRKVAQNADRKVLTSAAVTATAIAVLASVGLSMDNSPPEAPDITPLAESAPHTPTVTDGPVTAESEPDPTGEPTPAPEDPGAAHIEPATIPDGPLGIPGIALDAYHRATDRLNAEQPACEMDWTVLAGIGQVESNQGRGKFDVHGNTIGRIVGPRLDGSIPGTAVITDTDGGRFDGDADFDRAVGPVQFIPSTWALLGRDGNNDGVADPNNIYDGALAAATLLCNQGGSMADPAARTRAILAYNNSLAYVANVNAWAHGYAVNAYPLPSDLPPIHQPKPTHEEPKPPEKCPEGWEGTPTAAPEPAEPGQPEGPVPGCTEVPGSSTPPPPEPPPSTPEPSAPPVVEVPAPPAPPAPFALPEIELPCIAPFCPPPPA
ncbi:lytic transglycosylase domain-containing protein [Dietzia sp. NPDC055877]